GAGKGGGSPQETAGGGTSGHATFDEQSCGNSSRSRGFSRGAEGAGKGSGSPQETARKGTSEHADLNEQSRFYSIEPGRDGEGIFVVEGMPRSQAQNARPRAPRHNLSPRISGAPGKTNLAGCPRFRCVEPGSSELPPTKSLSPPLFKNTSTITR